MLKSDFILQLKHKPKRMITGLIHTGHCLVVGDRKCNVIGEIIYDNLEDNDHIGVCVYFNELDKTYRI